MTQPKRSLRPSSSKLLAFSALLSLVPAFLHGCGETTSNTETGEGAASATGTQTGALPTTGTGTTGTASSTGGAGTTPTNPTGGAAAGTTPTGGANGGATTTPGAGTVSMPGAGTGVTTPGMGSDVTSPGSGTATDDAAVADDSITAADDAMAADDMAAVDDSTADDGMAADDMAAVDDSTADDGMAADDSMAAMDDSTADDSMAADDPPADDSMAADDSTVADDPPADDSMAADDSAASEGPVFHVFLMMGQSNMVGAAALQQSDRNTDERLQVLGGCNKPAMQWSLADPPLHDCYLNPVGPGDWFGKTMLTKLKEGDTIGLVPTAVVGESINTFISGGSHHQDILNKIEYAKNTPNARFAGIIFHQGETDTGQSWWVERVVQLYDEVKAAMGIDYDIPFIAGELPADPGNCCSSHNPLVNQLPGALPMGYVVSQEGTKRVDQYHFDHESVVLMGTRYGETMIEALGW